MANAATAFYDSAEVTTRSGEVPAADWTGGMNIAASCAPGIGINTGDYDPKEMDWSRGGVPYTADSQYIGIDPGANAPVTGYDSVQGGWANAVFIMATGDVAPDGVIGQINANDVFNRTGKTIPNGSYAWGLRDGAVLISGGSGVEGGPDPDPCDDHA